MSEQKSYIEKAERWFGDTLIEQLKRIADALEAAHELATNPYRQP